MHHCCCARILSFPQNVVRYIWLQSPCGLTPQRNPCHSRHNVASGHRQLAEPLQDIRLLVGRPRRLQHPTPVKQTLHISNAPRMKTPPLTSSSCITGTLCKMVMNVFDDFPGTIAPLAWHFGMMARISPKRMNLSHCTIPSGRMSSLRTLCIFATSEMSIVLRLASLSFHSSPLG